MALTRRTLVVGAAAVLGVTAAGVIVRCSNEDLAGQKDQDSQGDGQRQASQEGNHQPDPIADAIASMSLEQKAAQLLAPTPEGLLGALDVDTSASDSYGEKGVTSVGDDLRDALSTYPVGGLCLFGANITGADQTRKLLSDLTEATKGVGAGIPAIISVDEEGGPLVARVANSGYFDVEKFPAMATLEKAGDSSKAQHVGQTIGKYLHELGFSMDLAPVADVLTNPDNTVIGTRSFGDDPDLVASMVEAEVQGFAEAGMACCAKHFPGHGDTVGDSHTGKATSTRSREELESCELVPFRAAIKAGVPAIMVGHIGVPAITGDDVPATLSPELIDGLLRKELGFDGLVVSDSMAMAAIGNDYHSDAAAVGFLKAGGDLVLGPNSLPVAYKGILDAVKNGDLTEDRVDQSLTRILKVKKAYGLI